MSHQGNTPPWPVHGLSGIWLTPQAAMRIRPDLLTVLSRSCKSSPHHSQITQKVTNLYAAFGVLGCLHVVWPRIESSSIFGPAPDFGVKIRQ